MVFVIPSSTASIIEYSSTIPPNTSSVGSIGVPVKPTYVAFGNESRRYFAKPYERLTPLSVISTFSSRPVCVRWASSLIQMMLALFESRFISFENFCIVVKNTPPLVLPCSLAFKSSRLSTCSMTLSPTNCFALSNKRESWSSRSVRSVMRMMVGLHNALLFISKRHKNNIVNDLPHPVAPKYVPPLPSPLGFSLLWFSIF